MKCDRAVDLLTGPVADTSAAERREAAAHAEACADCRDASMAVHALRLASMSHIPAADPRALARALSRPSAPEIRRPAGGNRFWLGTAVGAALAASAVLAVFWAMPSAAPTESIATPRLRMALNETRDVSIALTTNEALIDAAIRVRLNGGVGLAGFAGRQELEWLTDLTAGANQLTLPIVATGRDSGQVIVEITHGGKRKTFLVDIEINATDVDSQAQV